MKQCISLIMGCVLIGLSPSARALSATTQPLESNNFLFIENNIDNEYFITPSAQNPRFSGANTWVKLDGSNQVSIGYMGFIGWSGSAAYYKDMWIENSPISEPFSGLRCTRGANCPSSGFIAGDVTDQFGYYHAKTTGAGTDGGIYGFASFSNSAFEYFRKMEVGGNETFKLNFCRTNINYDYADGKRCKDQERGNWYIRPFSVRKLAHLSLFSTNAFQELFIASDGTPSINKDSGNCEIGVVDRADGVICKMVSYTLEQESRLTNRLTISMLADSSLLRFSPAPATIKYSGDGQTWTNYNTKSVYSNVFSSGNENKYVYVFLSKTFLKNMGGQWDQHIK
ncbi:CFA/I fimbrial minor adhesin (plasmid) [Klebsiella sp. PL-2018]|nr:CFA/I fimbrial minor adhesin [Klebsiella sp. PL-2018]